MTFVYNEYSLCPLQYVSMTVKGHSLHGRFRMHRKTILLGGSLQSVAVQLTDIGCVCCLFGIEGLFLGTWGDIFCFSEGGLHTANMFLFTYDLKSKKALHAIMSTSRHHSILFYFFSEYV